MLELAISPGIDQLHSAGGLAAFCAFDGRLVSVQLREEPLEAHGPPGWRGRRRPLVTREDGDTLTVLSPIDGSTHALSRSALAGEARALGAVEVDAIAGNAGWAWWRSPAEPTPAQGWVVSSVPADAARKGLYWGVTGWLEITAVTDAAEVGALSEGCTCRACSVAEIGYLGHLWRQREITATHLLGWHNTCQARSLVEG
ncbi:MAG: queuine tRNA-ribosyltransferase family protein [Candidatus Dormibacteraeota bacterium]|nr:queuine tRNA-ribosyltransferase family protein [Candidatus Dormibacteraeota bacterium]